MSPTTSGSTEEERQRLPARVPRRVSRIVEAARIDLAAIHAAWMALAFPREFVGEHAVVENWTPRTRRGLAAFRAWAALGVLVLVVL